MIAPLHGGTSCVTLAIGRRWDGSVVPAKARAELRLSWEDTALRLDVDAPFAGDPAPTTVPGPTAGLWNHEVVELFVVRPDGTYVELELGPHGHHLLLELSGVRVVARSELPVHDWSPTIANGRFRGTARIDRALFPDRPTRAAAFRVYGPAGARVHELVAPLPGAEPDFHQPMSFPTWLL